MPLGIFLLHCTIFLITRFIFCDVFHFWMLNIYTEVAKVDERASLSETYRNTLMVLQRMSFIYKKFLEL